MKFGTDGVRGIMGEDFTEDTVATVTRAICRMVARDGRHGTLTIDLGGGHIITHPFSRRLVIGFDRRNLSKEYANVAAEVAVHEGFYILLADSPASTPTLSFAVKAQEADGSIIITASHNPAAFNGLKFKPFYAGSSVDEITLPIEAELDALRDDNSAKPHWMGSGAIEEFKPTPDYILALRGTVDIDAIADSGMQPVFDSIHGPPRGCCNRYSRARHCT